MRKHSFGMALLCALIFALPGFVSQSLAQNVRWDLGAPGSAGAVTIQAGGTLFALGGVQLNWCNYPANAGSGVPCTNYANTYPTQTSSSPCATNQQIVLQGSTTCVSTGDNFGDVGVWTAPGTYAYTLTVNGVTYGPYVTPQLGASNTGGGVGTSSVGCNTVYNTTTTVSGNCVVLDASEVTVGDACAKVATQLAALGSGTGIINALGLSGSQTCAALPWSSFTGTATIWLPFGNWTTSVQWNIGNKNINLIGPAPTSQANHFTLTAAGGLTNTSLLNLSGANGNVISQIYLECSANTNMQSVTEGTSTNLNLIDIQTDQCTGSNSIPSFAMGGGGAGSNNTLQHLTFNNTIGSGIVSAELSLTDNNDNVSFVKSVGGTNTEWTIFVGGSGNNISWTSHSGNARNATIQLGGGGNIVSHTTGLPADTYVVVLPAGGTPNITNDTSCSGTCTGVDLIFDGQYATLPLGWSTSRTSIGFYMTGNGGQNGGAGTVLSSAVFQWPQRATADLPLASFNSGRVFQVTDSTTLAYQGQPCSGGGSTPAFAFSDGGAWRCFGPASTISGTTVGSLPAASTYAAVVFHVTDSTALASEGQTCVGGSSHDAIAISNGSIWKCF